jgi:hypothetical protein
VKIWKGVCRKQGTALPIFQAFLNSKAFAVKRPELNNAIYFSRKNFIKFIKCWRTFFLTKTYPTIIIFSLYLMSCPCSFKNSKAH